VFHGESAPRVLAAIGLDVLAGRCREPNNIVSKGRKSPAFSCLKTMKSRAIRSLAGKTSRKLAAAGRLASRRKAAHIMIDLSSL
jgi:hypothetical protein